MKELLMRVRIDGDEIETIVRPKGFDKSASTSLEIIGILQNVMALEMDKLRIQTRTRITPNKEGEDKDYG